MAPPRRQSGTHPPPQPTPDAGTEPTPPGGHESGKQAKTIIYVFISPERFATMEQLRDFCLKGPQTRLEVEKMTEIVDSLLIPNLERLLAEPPTTTFSQGHVSPFVVEWALEHKSYPLLQYLLLNGWEINLPTHGFFTGPSWLALPSVLKDSELAAWLLDHGADTGFGGFPTRTPVNPGDNARSRARLLHNAAYYGSLDTFRLLRSRGASLECSLALHAAASRPSQLPILLHLLDHEKQEVDINEYDWYCVPHLGPPIMYSIHHANHEAVRLLLENGADPEARRLPPFDNITAMTQAHALALKDPEAGEKIMGMLTASIEAKKDSP